MPRNVKRDNETKRIKSVILKYSKEISINTSSIRGVFTIKNLRKYEYRTEVDVMFKGEIHARVGDKDNLGWFDNNVLNMNFKGYRISIVKLNKFLRRNLELHVNSQLNIFSEELVDRNCIKKIEWI